MILRLFPILFLISLSLFSDENVPATLIVTYQTDENGERLDRVRFWLRNEEFKQWFFPKGSGFANDSQHMSRKVVIENLSPGDYTVEFLIPNRDDLFEEAVPRTLHLSAGEVVKIDQQLKWKKPPSTEEASSREERYGKLIVSYDLKLHPELSEQVGITIVDQDEETIWNSETGRKTEVPLNKGKMVMVPQLPIGSYKVELYLKKDPKKTLTTTPIEIQENRTESIHLALQNPSSASLTLFTNVPTALFQLRHLKTGETREGRGREHTFASLQPGAYLLSYKSTDPFFAPPPEEKIEIEPGSKRHLESSFKILGKIKIFTNISYALVEMRPLSDELPTWEQEIHRGEATLYVPEGKYQLIFKKIDERTPPSPISMEVHPLSTEEANIYYEGSFDSFRDD